MNPSKPLISPEQNLNCCFKFAETFELESHSAHSANMYGLVVHTEQIAKLDVAYSVCTLISDCVLSK